MQYYTVIKIMFLNFFSEEILMSRYVTFVENEEYRTSLKMMPLT